MPGNENAAPNSPDASAVCENPLTTLTRLLRMQLEICDDLEHVADSLPHEIDSVQCQQLAHLLRTIIGPVHELEERVVFPSILAAPLSYGISQQTLTRLRIEHGMDRGYASEIADLLSDLSRQNGDTDMNAAGYALRSFFESVRRHVHFDLEQIIPLARRWLDAADMERMSGLLKPHRLVVAQCRLQNSAPLKVRQVH